MYSTKSSSWLKSKMIAIFMAVALVFTMMPFSMGITHAEEQSDDPIVFTIVDTDGTQKDFTMSEIKAFNGCHEGAYTLSDGKTQVKGTYLKALLKSYSNAGKDAAVATVSTADNFSGTINASGKTVEYLRNNDYILAYDIDGDVLDPSVEKEKKKKDGTVEKYHDAGYFYLYGKINGEHQRDKYVNKIVLSEGGNTPDPVVEMADLTIKGDALVKEMEFSIKDLKNMTGIQKYESLDYPSLNSNGTEEVSKVDGVQLIDLINYVGLKSGIRINKVEAIPYKSGGTVDSGHIKTYTADQIQNTDIYGNKAMFIWAELEDKEGATKNKVQRTIRGQFSKTDINRSNWGKDIKVINVYGEKIPTPAPAPVKPKKGDKATAGGSSYTVANAAATTVVFTKAKNANKVTVPATVKIKGKTMKVTQVNAKAFTGKKIRTVTLSKNIKTIKANAFKGSKATKIIVKTKALTKKSVKKSLKGSKVKTVQVKVGSKKVNKKYVKKYKKIFTKKNAGKKVKVK